VQLHSYRWHPESEETDSADWLSVYSPIFTSTEPALTGLSGAHRIWASRRFVLSHATCNRATLIHEPSSALGLDHLGICLVLRGSMGLQANGAHVVAGPGDIALIDLREPVRLIFGVEGLTSELTLWVPRARLPVHFSNRSELHGLLAKAITPGITVVAATFRALLTQLDLVTVEEMDELVAGIVVLVGHAIDLHPASKASQPRQPAPLDTLVTLSRYIEDNLTARDLDAAKLAATFGLSRASLYRLFEPVGGVASFVRERRLARAHHELTRPGLQNRRIGPIAYQAGFHSIAAFNRVFRAAYGETPRNVRKRKSGFTPTARRLEEIGILARWLLEIAA
jgi:AraC-like DNA-binding protein